MPGRQTPSLFSEPADLSWEMRPYVCPVCGTSAGAELWIGLDPDECAKGAICPECGADCELHDSGIAILITLPPAEE